MFLKLILIRLSEFQSQKNRKNTQSATSKEEIKNVLVEMVDLPIDIFYQIVARKEWFINKSRLELKAEEIKLAMKIADELKEV